MAAYAMDTSTKKALKSHIFKFNYKIYVQEEGTAIGFGIAGDVVNVFMVGGIGDSKRN